MKLIKKNKGITLITLVITIAIMIILAIIAISSVDDTDILAQTEGAASRLNQLQNNEAALRNQLFDELKPGDDPTDGECKHNYEESYRVEEKCEVDGYIEYTCSICKDTYKKLLTKLEHDYKETIVAATCTEAGKITETCARCGKQNTTIVDSPEGHKLRYIYERTGGLSATFHLVKEKCTKCDYNNEYEEECSFKEYRTSSTHKHLECEKCDWPDKGLTIWHYSEMYGWQQTRLNKSSAPFRISL